MSGLHTTPQYNTTSHLSVLHYTVHDTTISSSVMYLSLRWLLAIHSQSLALQRPHRLLEDLQKQHSKGI